jgi:hypothetical protein
MSDQLEVTREVSTIALRTTPGGLATAATWGDHVGVIVGVLTAVFLILQISHLLWRWRRDWMRGQSTSVG